ncbi:hypothetical protein ACFY78_06360 [Streptomyces olindensis]|uniref:hypothetical protein n=1 Tax=Streptomyces olindensis TaxID=358823 RepID=UPI003686D754
MEMTKRRPRASFTLWVGSYLALAWAMVVHLVDRVLLFLTPTPRKRPARHSVMTLAALAALFTSRGTREAAHRNN